MFATKVSIIKSMHTTRGVYQLIALRNCSSNTSAANRQSNREHLANIHKQLSDSITEHPEDMTVRVRWRVVGTPGLSIIFKFWKYKIWKLNKSKDNSEWTDGFSIFYVGSDGLVHKHVVQKIMPDEERLQTSSKTDIGVKLAFIIGLVPDFSSESMDLFKEIVSKFLEISTKFGSFG